MSILCAGRSLTTNDSDYSTCQCTAFQIKDGCACLSTKETESCQQKKELMIQKPLCLDLQLSSVQSKPIWLGGLDCKKKPQSGHCLIWTLGKPLALATQSSCQKACQSESEKCLLEQHCKLGPYVAGVGAVLKNGSCTRPCPQSFWLLQLFGLSVEACLKLH